MNTETQLLKITELINTFNRESELFEAKLFVTRKADKRYMTLEQVMEKVCKFTGITPEYLNMKSREPNIVLPRQIAHYLAQKRSKNSLAQIGNFFGNKNHSTVLHSCRTIQDCLDTDREFREKYHEFLNQ